MKKTIKLLALAAAISSLTACGFSKVEPGEVGVIVSTAGSDKGVDMKPAKSGWNFTGPTENLYTFKTFDQNVDLGTVSFADADGARVTATVGVTAYAEADSAPKLFLKYRKDLDGIISTNVVQVLKTSFANEASKLKVDAIYGAGQEAFLKRVEARIRDHFVAHGLVVSNLYLLDSLDLPADVKAALNKKVLANQLTEQKNNEVAQATAEANKLIEQAKGEKAAAIARAEGQAEAIALVGKSIRENPQYLEQQRVEKWDGKLPVYMTDGATTPIMSLK